MSSTDDKLDKEEPVQANSVEFRISSDPRMLKIIRAGVSTFCELAGFSTEESSSVMLAVDEACSNIIKHTYEGAPDKPIVVRCSVLPQGVRITLRDFGEKVRLHTIKSRNLSEIRPGGLGVHLINSVMDEVSFDKECEVGNCLTLVKYFRPQKEDV